MDNIKKLLNSQIKYYKERANEYDDWFFRRERYSQGEELNSIWFNEVEYVKQAIKRSNPKGNILEIACGTGIWTKELQKYSDNITAIDTSVEALKINSQKLSNKNVIYIKDSFFKWDNNTIYDYIFFGFWLSHIPQELFKNFWEKVNKYLEQNGKVFFVDSKYHDKIFPSNKYKNKENVIERRTLNNRKEFKIVKIYYEPEQLSKKLNNMGWNFKISSTKHFLMFGEGKKTI